MDRNMEIKLSERMEAVLGLAGKGRCIADIGCDHALLSMAAVQRGLYDGALAMDLREGPLEAAKKNILETGFSDRIECRLSDGADGLNENECDAAIVAGMGGHLIINIVKKNIGKFRALDRFVLQPQSDVGAVRRFLIDEGFEITDEDMVFEDGKYYPMMSLTYRMEDSLNNGLKPEGYDDVTYEFGKYLIAKKNPVLMDYLEYREGILAGVIANIEQADMDADRKSERLGELNRELDLVRRGLCILKN
ncbi:MAG: SAM-dependent methyltransferase [Lachnospiraceae bacterium]|nr:SAM-dependent methyltransferase [Lachnospiraceae bacterium]